MLPGGLRSGFQRTARERVRCWDWAVHESWCVFVLSVRFPHLCANKEPLDFNRVRWGHDRSEVIRPVPQRHLVPGRHPPQHDHGPEPVGEGDG